MSLHRPFRSALATLLVVTGLSAVGVSAAVVTAAPASAATTTTTTSFTTRGCSTFSVPLGVTSIDVTAVGAAGSPVTASPSALGGLGGGASGRLSGLSGGSSLYVCVDSGGSSSAQDVPGGSGSLGGGGGGASGVALGATFSAPVVVAGGGGGAARFGVDYPGLAGGAAGAPVAGDGVSGCTSGLNCQGLGGNNTTGQPGGPSAVSCCATPPGAMGSSFTAAGPGAGAPAGSGRGGGGAGLYGGGAGGLPGSGGGGTSYCGSQFLPNGSPVSLSGCTTTSGVGTQTSAGAAAGFAKVVLTYELPTTELVFTQAPADGTRTNAASVTLAWSVTPADADAGVVCSFGNATVTCPGGQFTFTLPSEGSRTLSVELSVNGQTSTIQRTIVVDRTAPTVQYVSGPRSGQLARAGAVLEWSSPDTDVDRFECRIDTGQWRTCTSPYTVTPASMPDGDRVVAVRAVDTATNEGQAIPYNFRLDTEAPFPPIIGSGPDDGARVSSAPSYGFSSLDADLARFECRLDDGAWATCASPYAVPGAGLAEGPHLFGVRAVDTAGNTGLTVERGFTYDVTAPGASIESGPTDGAVVGSRPSYGFSSSASDVAGFECRIGTAAYATCSSPFQVPGPLADGPASFSVRAVDTAGNTGSAVVRDFTLDTTAPSVQIDNGPDGARISGVPAYAFSSTSADLARFECRVDDGVWSTCTSPQGLPGTLAEGEHSFAVRAVDTVGNTSAEVSRSFVLDVTPPTVAITSGPDQGSFLLAAPQYGYSAPATDVDRVECRTSRGTSVGDWVPCTSPAEPDVSAPGTYLLELRAVDTAGNAGPVVSRAFTYVPVVPLPKGPPPTVAGLGQVGQVLTVSVPTRSDAPGVTVSYQWQQLLDGGRVADVPGATGESLRVPAALVGATLQVVVRHAGGGYTPRSDVVALPAAEVPVRPGTMSLAGVTVTGLRDGAPRSGKALRASLGRVTLDGFGTSPAAEADGLRVRYQWSADGVAIPGATRAFFRPRVAQLGSRFSVTVSAVVPGFGRSAEVTSSPTMPTRLGRLLVAPASAVVGQRVPLVSVVPPKAVGYRILLGGRPIAGGPLPAGTRRWEGAPLVPAGTACGPAVVRALWLDARGRVIHRDRAAIRLTGC